MMMAALRLATLALCCVLTQANLSPFNFIGEVPRKCVKRFRNGLIPDLAGRFDVEEGEIIIQSDDNAGNQQIVSKQFGDAVGYVDLVAEGATTFVLNEQITLPGKDTGLEVQFICALDFANYPFKVEAECANERGTGVSFRAKIDVIWGDYNKRTCNPHSLLLATTIFQIDAPSGLEFSAAGSAKFVRDR